MADDPSARAKVQVEEVDFDSPVTEVLMTSTFGANINYLIDERDTLRTDIDGNASDITNIENNVRAGDLVNGLSTSLAGGGWTTISTASGTLRQVTFSFETGSGASQATNSGFVVHRGMTRLIVSSGSGSVAAGYVYEFRISGNAFQCRYTSLGFGSNTNITTWAMLWRDF